jgi:protein-L-isoaspartate(D-aspartate) O-methyltransferase
MATDHFEVERQVLIAAIRTQASHVSAEIGKAGIDERVLRAMTKVPRHEFVPAEVQVYAYVNMPLPIGHGKTISQPFIVAVMTDLLDVRPDDVVLEIGTGLGYQTAILAELAGRVYSVELIEDLTHQAKRRLGLQGYTNIEIRVGNGYHGWAEHSPFDKVIVSAAPDLIPPPLIYQLKAGGRMVLPVGLADSQHLIVADKGSDGRLTTRQSLAVRFSALDDPDEPVLRPS